tara:strand:- start:321 stop:683 length:363 start_codon:yes stop_codon:yes gene_type:complete
MSPTDKTQLSATDQSALYDALRIINAPDSTPEEKKAAIATQGRLKERYGKDIYGTARRIQRNNVFKDTGLAKGGMPKKTAMMRGGMANGKEHMYAAGGVVNDGLKALAKTRPDVVAKILK